MFTMFIVVASHRSACVFRLAGNRKHARAHPTGPQKVRTILGCTWEINNYTNMHFWLRSTQSTRPGTGFIHAPFAYCNHPRHCTENRSRARKCCCTPAAEAQYEGCAPSASHRPWSFAPSLSLRSHGKRGTNNVAQPSHRIIGAGWLNAWFEAMPIRSGTFIRVYS